MDLRAPRLGRASYAGWVRDAIALSRRTDRKATGLFESSMPEPLGLLRQAVTRTMEPEFSRYYASAFSGGNPYVRDILAKNYNVANDRVLCTTGATAALALVYRTLLRPGDRVLIETPGFDVFSALAEEQGVAVDTFERAGDRFVVDVAAVERRLRPETRLVVLSNLHNPSGMPVSPETMSALADLAERRGFHLVVDEVYRDYVPPERRPSAAAALSRAIISISSLTKIYGLSTLRCGWMVGAPDVIADIRDLAGRIEFGISNLSHAVAAHVLADPAPFDDYSRGYVEACRPILETWYAAAVAEGLVAGALPDDGCICFPALPGIADTLAFSNWLIAEAGVIVAPGDHFGAPGHIRIGFCLPPEDLESGLAALADGLRRWPGMRPPTPPGGGERPVPLFTS